jgi:hypothetical protein
MRITWNVRGYFYRQQSDTAMEKMPLAVSPKHLGRVVAGEGVVEKSIARPGGSGNATDR